ncbi:hypothetical protein LOK49_LG10G02857 [Camellia lanceoleosa]|uniref:Uncharacterized protein n=1 Tax=Camellia lanceoleosa TaxID=1840588 RepID=A0ACC0GAY9_9ERIC|nr:hypothetical protein LOK49_LG10G02857 [Camellia lanceoleosa]
MEMDLGIGKAVCVIEAEFSLVHVGGRANIVNRYVVGGNQAGELEDLVEVAIHGKRHHDYNHFSLLGGMAWMLVMNLHG